MNTDKGPTAEELKAWEDEEYPHFVEVDGKKYRASFQLPEGYKTCWYHVSNEKYLDPCVRCTDAHTPDSTRDVCLGMQFTSHRPDSLILRSEHFVTG